MGYSNAPKFDDSERVQWTHQPLTFEHYGIHASIKENGKVVISSGGVKNPETNEIEYDEVEVPASLIFKLASALKLTRTATIVDKS